MGNRNLITSKDEFIKSADQFFGTVFGKNHASICGDIEIRVFTGSDKQRFCGKT